MVAFSKINDFVEDLGNAIHNLSSDTVAVALSNTAPGSETSDPTLDGNGVLANVTQIDYTNYTDDLTTDRELDGVTFNLSSGVATLDAPNFTITASGGPLASWQYLYIYNKTAASNQLIGYWDNGSAISLADGESVNVQFDASGILDLS